MITTSHEPVLLNEVIEALAPEPGQVIIDGTYGRGGHTREILPRLMPGGRMILVDRDREAVIHAEEQWGRNPAVFIHQGSFSGVESILQQHDLFGKIDAYLFDFGVSSPQLNIPARGFSFSNDGPLDMRMDRDSGVDAATWIREVEEDELVRVLKLYGEERFARRIARAIKNALMAGEIKTTGNWSSW